MFSRTWHQTENAKKKIRFLGAGVMYGYKFGASFSVRAKFLCSRYRAGVAVKRACFVPAFRICFVITNFVSNNSRTLFSSNHNNFYNFVFLVGIQGVPKSSVNNFLLSQSVQVMKVTIPTIPWLFFVCFCFVRKKHLEHPVYS